MYRIYVLRQRKGGSDVLTETRTQTPSRQAAEFAWWELYRASYDDRHLLLLSRDGSKIASHRYSTEPGHPDHFPRDAKLPD